ncbi:unnamed protein product [Amoebophrya sp. A25]|nr:unnamed protein product [Amoebophrya sp. A25]|eukprot:GSA25T00001736001.1
MLQRSSTFLVGTRQQRVNLAEFGKEERETVEAAWLRRNVPLCFACEAYQDTHPAKKQMGLTDADATLCSPMMVGVMDGVSQLEEFGMDPSELPQQLCRAVEELAFQQLLPETDGGNAKEIYRGPVSLLSDAYQATDALGSTTVLLCALDNHTKVHGRTHPMIAVLSIGDCELLLLRRSKSTAPLETIFHTEMQRIGGNKQAPLQVARVDERIDEDFEEEIALEVIRDGSAVHCFTAQEGDVVIMGSDGVFDNLYAHEVVSIVNSYFAPAAGGKFVPQTSETMKAVCKAVVAASHAKSGEDGKNRTSLTPLGYGGKIDDTSCVVGEVVEYTSYHSDLIHRARRQRKLKKFYGCMRTACFPVTACASAASAPCREGGCCAPSEKGVDAAEHSIKDGISTATPSKDSSASAPSKGPYDDPALARDLTGYSYTNPYATFTNPYETFAAPSYDTGPTSGFGYSDYFAPGSVATYTNSYDAYVNAFTKGEPFDYDATSAWVVPTQAEPEEELAEASTSRCSIM